MASPPQKWNITASVNSLQTSNPLRDIVEQLDMKAIPKDKKFLSLAIGDPVAFPNFVTDPNITNAVSDTLHSERRNKYMHTSGYKKARIALAKKYTSLINSGNTYTSDDVYVTVGCVGSINLAFMALLNPGDNILIPRPGFSYYKTVTEAYGFECRFYNCLPDKAWSVDANHLESRINNKTKAIFINNPSNPCGTVLTKSNLLEIVKIAQKYKLPIIADEIYGEMTYPGYTFYSCAQVAAEYNLEVPVLVLSGMAKYWLVPGWKVGWMIIHDPFHKLNLIRPALRNLATLALSPASIIQVALPQIIEKTPISFHNNLNKRIYQSAMTFYDGCTGIPQLTPIKPEATLYMMVGIKLDRFSKESGIVSCVTFTEKLLREQGLLVLPGVIFGMKNYFRVVLCPPVHVMHDVIKRIKEFCNKHSAQKYKSKL